MRIVLTTFGTLGDVHPLIAVARFEICQRGHTPSSFNFLDKSQSREAHSAGIAIQGSRVYSTRSPLRASFIGPIPCFSAH
jgi:UDP:flavonoid glycosyltransferase YjiC (YdhE family)